MVDSVNSDAPQVHMNTTPSPQESPVAKKNPSEVPVLKKAINFQCLHAVLALATLFNGGTSVLWGPLVVDEIWKDSMDPHDVGPAWFRSLIFLGACMGSLLAFVTGPCTSKKWMIFFMDIPYLFCWLITTYTRCTENLFFTRILSGVAFGTHAVLAPLYATEIAGSKMGTTIIPIALVMFMGGVLYVQAWQTFLARNTLSIACALPAVIATGASFVAPESPLRLVALKRIDDAKHNLTRLLGSETLAEKEIETLIEQANYESEKRNLKVFLETHGARDGTIISFFLIFFGSISGVNIILLYSPYFFQRAGIPKNEVMYPIILAGGFALSSLFAIVSTQYARRKMTLVISGLFMALSHALLAYFFFLESEKGLASDSIIAPMLLFAISSSMGFGVISWVSAKEILPPALRTEFFQLMLPVYWIVLFGTTRIFPFAAYHLGLEAIFGAFGVICVISAVFCGVFAVETKNRPYTEVQTSLTGLVHHSNP